MAFKRGLASWQVLLLAMGAVARDDSTSSRENTPILTSSNSAADDNGGSADNWGSLPQPRSNFECPAVCPSYPGCPAWPGCPACPSAPPCPRVIPPGYHYYQGHGYYKMHYEEKTWVDAKGTCEREGGYLVVINSQAEADLISRIVAKHQLPISNFTHIGFFDLDAKQKYITVLDDTLSSTGYFKWGPRQPSGPGKENCGAFWFNEGLDDMICSYTRTFICELLA